MCPKILENDNPAFGAGFALFWDLFRTGFYVVYSRYYGVG
jgi:hypothetical protein